jgi:hypothetical protein
MFPRRISISAFVAAVAVVVSACYTTPRPPSTPTAAVATPDGATSSSATAGVVRAVSASNPTAGAADAFAKCHIGDTVSFTEVAGMGEIDPVSDVPHYVPLTGREPQLQEHGAAWVVQVRGDILQRGGEIWTDPTCIVTEHDFGYFATGPVTVVSTGKVFPPEAPTIVPDRTLPPLVR